MDCEHPEVGYEVGATVSVGETVVSTVHRFSCAGCDACARIVTQSAFEEEPWREKPGS